MVPQHLQYGCTVLNLKTKQPEEQRVTISIHHKETLKQKIMKLRKENESLKRQLHVVSMNFDVVALHSSKSSTFVLPVFHGTRSLYTVQDHILAKCTQFYT